MSNEEFAKQLEIADAMVASWPLWKQNILESMSKSTVSVPRDPVDNKSEDDIIRLYRGVLGVFHNCDDWKLQLQNLASKGHLEWTDYLKAAYIFAIQNSTDPSTQNGAIVVRESCILAYGANHFPRDVKESKARWARPLKYSFVEHAERNAIFYAARNGIKLDGATMYVPWFSCADCARAIIQSGISEVVGHDSQIHKTWNDSIEIALQMFDEAGVKYRWIKASFGLKIRFNGELKKI